MLLFFKPEIGNSVNEVYRLSRLYDRLSERSALMMLAAWRGSTLAGTRAKYRAVTVRRRAPARARGTPQTPARGAAGSNTGAVRTGPTARRCR